MVAHVNTVAEDGFSYLALRPIGQPEARAVLSAAASALSWLRISAIVQKKE